MATLLSRIFGKKTAEPAPPAPANEDLDITALKPLMTPAPPASTEPKDLSGAWRMEQVLEVFPSAQRALFQKFHIGGCSSCGFQPSDSLETVAVNHGLDVNDLVTHIHQSATVEQDLEITPRETAELLEAGKIKLLDVRTPEEYRTASVAGSILVDQAAAQEIMQSWPKDTAIVTICHHGIRSLDAAAYLRGHGFTNTRSMKGGIDAWSAEIDPSVPSY